MDKARREAVGQRACHVRLCVRVKIARDDREGPCVPFPFVSLILGVSKKKKIDCQFGTGEEMSLLLQPLNFVKLNSLKATLYM